LAHRSLDAQSAAVAAELVLERDEQSRVDEVGVVLLLGLVDETRALLLAALAGLVPPPLVDLLLSHFQLCAVELFHLLDAFTGPEQVFGELLLQNGQLSLRLSLALGLNATRLSQVRVFRVFLDLVGHRQLEKLRVFLQVGGVAFLLLKSRGLEVVALALRLLLVKGIDAGDLESGSFLGGFRSYWRPLIFGQNFFNEVFLVDGLDRKSDLEVRACQLLLHLEGGLGRAVGGGSALEGLSGDLADGSFIFGARGKTISQIPNCREKTLVLMNFSHLGGLGVFSDPLLRGRQHAGGESRLLEGSHRALAEFRISGSWVGLGDCVEFLGSPNVVWRGLGQILKAEFLI